MASSSFLKAQSLSQIQDFTAEMDEDQYGDEDGQKQVQAGAIPVNQSVSLADRSSIAVDSANETDELMARFAGGNVAMQPLPYCPSVSFSSYQYESSTTFSELEDTMVQDVGGASNTFQRGFSFDTRDSAASVGVAGHIREPSPSRVDKHELGAQAPLPHATLNMPEVFHDAVWSADPPSSAHNRRNGMMAKLQRFLGSFLGPCLNGNKVQPSA